MEAFDLPFLVSCVWLDSKADRYEEMFYIILDSMLFTAKRISH